MDRRDQASALFALAVVLVAVGPALWGGGIDVPDDMVYYSLASWGWLQHAVTHGISPWWVPGKLGGVSLFGDVVPMGPFYPAIVLSALGPVAGLGWATVLHGLGTLLSVRWLARTWGISPALAWTVGAAVVAGPLGMWSVLDGHVESWACWALYPVVLVAMERAAEGGAHRGRWLLGGALALGLLLLGTHLRLAAAATASLGLWALLRGRDLRGSASIGVIGVLLGTPGWLPLLLESRQALSATAFLPRPMAAPDLALRLSNLPGLIAPVPPVLDPDLGVGTILGLGGLLAALGWRTLDTRSKRALILVAILLLAGTDLGPVQRILLLPLRILSAPVDLVWSALAVPWLAVLGAVGWERVNPGALSRRARRLGLVLIWAVLLVTMVRAMPNSKLLPGALLPRAAGESWVQVVLVLGLLAQSLVTRPVGADLRRRIVVFALIDLLVFAIRSHTLLPSPTLIDPSVSVEDRALIEGGVLDVVDLSRGYDAALGSRDGGRGDDEIRVPEVDVPRLQADLFGRRWPPHLAVVLGLPGLAGRSKVPPARALEMLAPLQDAVLNVERSPGAVLDLFGRPDGLGARTMRWYGIGAAVVGDQAVFHVGGSALPCTWASRVEVISDPQARVARLLGEDPGADRAVLLESPLLPGPPLAAPTSLRCDGDALVAQVPPGARSLLVLNRRVHPGWRADGDGRSWPLLPVDQIHSGVLLPQGAHTLRLRFVPPGLRLAGGLSFLAGLVSLFGLVVALKRPKAAFRPSLVPLFLAATFAHLVAPRPAAAAPPPDVVGAVLGLPLEPPARVLLVRTLDLTDPDAVVAESQVDADHPSFRLAWRGPLNEGAWVFLDQSIPGPHPQRHLRPWKLHPFDPMRPPRDLRLQAVPAPLAQQRAAGIPAPGYGVRVGLLAAISILTLLAVQLGRRPREPARPPPLQMHASWLERAAVGVAIVLGLGLRLPMLVLEPVDFEEHSYASFTMDTVPEDLATDLIAWVPPRPSCVDVVHPPLWHLLMAAIPAGLPPWTGRLPSLVLSLATIAAAARLLRRHSGRAAGLAAFAVAVAPGPVYYGRTATPYALTLLAAVLGADLLIRAVAGSRRAWIPLAWLLSSTLLCHLGAAIPIAGFAVAGALLARRSDADPDAALHAVRAFAPALVLPLLWSVVHFAWFPAVGLDTRLFADVYPEDPGILRFVGSLAVATMGAPGSQPVGALVTLPLLVLGAAEGWRRTRPLTITLLAMAGAWLGATIFFHLNLTHTLGDHVFWGFRWVAWGGPLLLALAALGLAAPDPSGAAFPTATDHLHAALRAGCALLWLSVALRCSLHRSDSPHPDYRSAAQRIAEEAIDGDALFTLPLWAARDPIVQTLQGLRPGAWEDQDGGARWVSGDLGLWLEAQPQQLPAESGMRNTRLTRLWLARVDEPMFGHEKFSTKVADQTLRWADSHLKPDGRWAMAGIELRRYRPGQPPTLPPTLAPWEVDLLSAPFLPPSSQGCDPTSGRWRLGFALPPAALDRIWRGQTTQGLLARSVGGAGVTVTGGLCAAPPPTLTLGPEPQAEEPPLSRDGSP